MRSTGKYKEADDALLNRYEHRYENDVIEDVNSNMTTQQSQDSAA